MHDRTPNCADGGDPGFGVESLFADTLLFEVTYSRDTVGAFNSGLGMQTQRPICSNESSVVGLLESFLREGPLCNRFHMKTYAGYKKKTNKKIKTRLNSRSFWLYEIQSGAGSGTATASLCYLHTGNVILWLKVKTPVAVSCSTLATQSSSSNCW